MEIIVQKNNRPHAICFLDFSNKKVNTRKISRSFSLEISLNNLRELLHPHHPHLFCQSSLYHMLNPLSNNTQIHPPLSMTPTRISGSGSKKTAKRFNALFCSIKLISHNIRVEHQNRWITHQRSTQLEMLDNLMLSPHGMRTAGVNLLYRNQSSHATVPSSETRKP